MKRVTKKDAAGHYYMTGDGIFLVRSVRDRFMGKDVDAVGAIEDILGDDYELDRLRELVEADREERVKIEPKARLCPKCGKHTVFPRIDRKFFYCYSCKTQFSESEYHAALKGGHR